MKSLLPFILSIMFFSCITLTNKDFVDTNQKIIIAAHSSDFQKFLNLENKRRDTIVIYNNSTKNNSTNDIFKIKDNIYIIKNEIKVFNINKTKLDQPFEIVLYNIDKSINNYTLDFVELSTNKTIGIKINRKNKTTTYSLGAF